MGIPLWRDHRRFGAYMALAAFVVVPVNLDSSAAWADEAPAAVAVGAERASVNVRDLRCEYLQNPIGIDVALPRLSWKLHATDSTERGQRQTGYHVLVASSMQNLVNGVGDLWDSGDVVSDQSVLVVYQGKPLSYPTACFWKVRVKDQNGCWAPWSNIGKWTLGPAKIEDWHANWIGCAQQFRAIKKLPPVGEYLADPWLRKTVTLRSRSTHAMMYVASVGYHELYVNGRKVTDTLLVPNVSDHTKRARYVTYDIARLLRPGKNVIGLWLGTSWSVYPLYKTPDKPQTPIVLAQADIQTEDGKQLQVVTDATWKTHPSPNALLGKWNFTDFGGEFYDGMRAVPDWCLPKLDDGHWESATVYHPKLMVSADMAEPNRRMNKKITPIAIRPEPDGRYRVDMGVNFAGVLEFDLRGTPGDLIELEFSEREDQPMTHRIHSAVRIGRSGSVTFRNRFNYLSGRWIRVTGLKSAPTVRDIRGFVVRSSFARAGWFRCGNELLNRIYDTTLWTYESLSLGGYVVDCPQRERMGYGGDAHATTQTALDNYRVGAFYTKWSQDWRDVQNRAASWGVGQEAERKDAQEADGNLPYTAPTYWGGGGPAWSGFCVTLPWYMYRQYGDQRILEVNFKTIQRWLAFLETKSKDDILVRWGGKWDFLGDWLWPGADGVNGDTRETLFFNNCYWVFNLQTAAKIADVLDKKDVANTYRKRADAVRHAVHRTFYDAKQHGYVNNLQAYLAIALLTDVTPEAERTNVWKNLEDEIQVHQHGHFWGGITGGAFIVKTLVEAGRSDLMFEMASKADYPSWGDMLRQGATTIWEAWDGHNSRLHSSYLHVGSWFIEGLAGIRSDPANPGFKHVIIEPGVITDGRLNWVGARLDSPYGLIRSQWFVDADQLEIQVTVPPNTTATLLVPSSNMESIRERGKMPESSPSVTSRGRDKNGHCIFELAPGQYVFTAKL